MPVKVHEYVSLDKMPKNTTQDSAAQKEMVLHPTSGQICTSAL